MNTKIIRLLAPVGFLLFLLPVLRADEPACTTRSLQGAYGYTVRGTTPANAQFAAVGRIVFDGRGQVSTVRTLSNGGAVVRNDAGTGTYTLGADCRGSFTIGAVGLGQLQVDFVLSGSGQQELRGIVTNPGFVLTLDGVKQKSAD
jgi:hypothetical protein